MPARHTCADRDHPRGSRTEPAFIMVQQGGRPILINCVWSCVCRSGRRMPRGLTWLPTESWCSILPLSMMLQVSKPRWGWSGKPADASFAGMRSSSSIRKGSRFRSLLVPRVLQMRTPAPAIKTELTQAYPRSPGSASMLLETLHRQVDASSPTFHHLLPLDNLLNLSQRLLAHSGHRPSQSSACQRLLEERTEGCFTCQIDLRCVLRQVLGVLADETALKKGVDTSQPF